jgi:hypothetical protein
MEYGKAWYELCGQLFDIVLCLYLFWITHLELLIG